MPVVSRNSDEFGEAICGSNGRLAGGGGGCGVGVLTRKAARIPPLGVDCELPEALRLPPEGPGMLVVGEADCGDAGEPKAGDVGREAEASGTDKRDGVRRPGVREAPGRPRPMLLVLLERLWAPLALFSRDMAAELFRRSLFPVVSDEVLWGCDPDADLTMEAEPEWERSIGGGGSGGGITGGSSPELVEMGKSGIWRMCSVSIRA